MRKNLTIFSKSITKGKSLNTLKGDLETTLAVTWESIDNAGGYQIVLYRGDSIEYVILSSTIIDASEASQEYYDLDTEETYTVSVVALGSASQNSDSFQAFRAIVQGLRLRLRAFLEGPLQ